MKNRVIIGAGDQRWEGWIATQQAELDLLKPETFTKFFADERAEKLLCEHTWEHLTIEEGVVAARTCFQFLVPGGRLRVAAPDGRFPDAEYQRTVQVGGPGRPIIQRRAIAFCTSPRLSSRSSSKQVSRSPFWNGGTHRGVSTQCLGASKTDLSTVPAC